MHVLLKQSLWLLACSLLSSIAIAGQMSAKLNLQLELESSCNINNQPIDDGTNGLNFGQLNFGEVSASFNHVLETSLSNGSTAGLTIQCPENLPIRITFGAGLHDNHVPAPFNTNYFHAVSNGTDFLAYNILYGSGFEILRPNQSVTLNNNGQLQTLNLTGRTVNNGRAVSLGQYTDTIPITIEF
ncbi:spore coat protein U domain-containing protein [Acinetobacter nematophilus]|uniref:Spore coat protein U domain-containing protein n=1 Tax=Acinetobacter nematophilus TaxID=2994642 RepID=A0A9X3IH71_9GAMM|nr:spore coat protein U domain-containing protein [Acinetobacter nematophilus]MCX5468623.1 spore coat protein U domain-containing protein [Acinetobacter nematophilus]